MNRHASIAAEAFAAGSFAISVLLTALRTTDTLAALHTEQVLLEPRTAPLSGFSAPVVAVRDNLLSVVSQPTNPVLWALLIAVILAALMHVLTASRNRYSTPRSWMLPAGLLVAALWPWVLNPAPLAGLPLAALSCLLLVRGLSDTLGDTTPDADPVEPILRAGPAPQLTAFIAGWLLVAATSALGTFVHHRLGMGLERSVLVGLLLAALLGAWGQLRMERAVTFSLAIIWAMIGFAAAAAGASITIATACVLGIAALAVVLVRVTT